MTVKTAYIIQFVGISRIQATAQAAVQGNEIQKYGSSFFHNMGRPSGILTAPGKIDPKEAKDIQDAWKKIIQVAILVVLLF